METFLHTSTICFLPDGFFLLVDMFVDYQISGTFVL